MQPEAHGDPRHATPTGVEPSRAAVTLALVVAVLGTFATSAGLLWRSGEAPDRVTSVHGEEVELYGEGLYRHDTVFAGAANRGSDLATLVLGVPLLVVSAAAYRRGSPGGALLLAGALSWFLYLYASLALGAAYNELFLAYVVLFGASLFGLALTVRSIDPRVLDRRTRGRLPRAGLTVLLAASGLVTLVVWLSPLVGSLLRAGPPELLGHGTTMVTYALDLAVITPATFLAAKLVWQRHPLGLLLAFPLLVVLVALFPAIVGQTAFQLAAGVELGPAEILGPLSGFLVLGAAAAWLVALVLRALR